LKLDLAEKRITALEGLIAEGLVDDEVLMLCSAAVFGCQVSNHEKTGRALQAALRSLDRFVDNASNSDHLALTKV
jgi:hypothetical protein